MRIASNKTQQPPVNLEASQRSERSASAAPIDRVETDKVVLSESATLDAGADPTAAVRAARIAEVKAQIANGGYPLDFPKLAERIVADEIGRAGG